MFDLFSMEADNDDIDIDVSESVTINDETAVDEAGSDSETVDVSDISEKTEAHNEAASAGGVATGNNVEQISMDPVAAEESYIFKQFGLSTEDLEEAVNETIAEAEQIPNADVVEDDDSDLAETAVSSGGEVVTADENNLDNTPSDNADVTPDVVPEDYAENVDAPGTVVRVPDPEATSSEGLAEVFLKNPTIDAYFGSDKCKTDQEKFKAFLEKNGYKAASKKDYINVLETKIKVDKNNHKSKIYREMNMLVTNNGITYIIVPSGISLRSAVLPYLNLITMTASFFINLAKHQMKGLLYPLYTKPNGEVYIDKAVADCTIKKSEFKNYDSTAKIANEIIRNDGNKKSNESLEDLLDFCYFA